MFDEVFNSNVTMAYNAVRACLPGMLERKFGRLLLLGSNVVQTGLPSGSAYAAAKAAIVNLVRSVALEAAPSNVLINAISPAPIETDLEADYQGEYLAFRQRYFETYKKMSPTGKLISLEELRLTIEFLLDSGLQNLTGQNIILDGGLSAPILGSPNSAT
jgi:NAD(P)-dependent dehydrogenase (short-subunit alcohol dehydrogenase family)